MAATFIARKAVELDLVPGRSPISVAAAAIYMASQASAEKKTQKGKWKRFIETFDCSVLSFPEFKKRKRNLNCPHLLTMPYHSDHHPNYVSDAPTEIGDIAGVADVTIRQSYRLIYPRAAELFPPDFKFDTPVDKLPQL